MSGERPQPETALRSAYALLGTARSLDDVVSALRDTARDVTGADGIAVVLREGDLCHYITEDSIRFLWQGQRFPVEACISGWAMLNDETAIVPDVSVDPRVPREPYQDKSIHSLVMTPIGKPRPVAAVGAYWCALVDIETETVARIEALAHYATLAVARIEADQSAVWSRPTV